MITFSTRLILVQVYPDFGCESSPSKAYHGTGDSGCHKLTTARRSFELDNAGGCSLALFSNDDCDSPANAHFFGDVACHHPLQNWNSFDIYCT